MRDRKNNLVVLTAGGTGGHIYPADALATELEDRGYRVILFTDSRGLNNYKGKLGEIENKSICSGSVVGKSLITKVCSLFKVGFGVLQALIILIKNRPHCVVGFGGYASFPTAVAAVILRIPLIIHEQNSVMSRTNRMLANFATVVAQSFREVKNTPRKVKMILSGMPVRKSITDLHNREYVVGKKMTVIVLGGSQGAKIFAEIVPVAVKMLSDVEQRNLMIYQQCRKGEEDVVGKLYENVGVKAVVKSFFDNMPKLYEEASLIISRSGASSVYEIAAVGLPAVLVPLPTAADNHQYYNAKEFADSGAGVVVEQKDFTAELLKDILHRFMDNPDELKRMSGKVKNLAIIDAAKRLADAVEHIN